MLRDYFGDPFTAGSSYCSSMVHRMVNGVPDTMIPNYLGTRRVGGTLFYMYDFLSVFNVDGVELKWIHFNIRGGCSPPDEDDDDDHQGDQDRRAYYEDGVYFD